MCGTDTYDLTRQIDGFMTELKRDVSRGDIDSDVAQSYADHFGRTISTRYRVVLSVEIALEVEVPAGYDISDLPGDIEISVDTSGYGSDVSIEDTDICSVDVDDSDVMED